MHIEKEFEWEEIIIFSTFPTFNFLLISLFLHLRTDTLMYVNNR